MKWVTSLVVVVGMGVCTPALSGHNLQVGVVAESGDPAFTLQSFDGPVTLEQFQGKFLLMFFGFTSCPDICPVTLARLSKSFSRLSEGELAQVAGLFVSLDPGHDTPEILMKYTSYFHENIIGATASPEVLDQLVRRVGVTYQREKSPDAPRGYVISHTADLLIVDRNGQLLDRRIPSTASSTEISEIIQGLLNT
ncbi:MAG: SCO family protein [Gammaproteobacteria bacterium]|nr:SCO family protein [Gammaproteobacteria bacterium]